MHFEIGVQPPPPPPPANICCTNDDIATFSGASFCCLSFITLYIYILFNFYNTNICLPDLLFQSRHNITFNDDVMSVVDVKETLYLRRETHQKKMGWRSPSKILNQSDHTSLFSVRVFFLVGAGGGGRDMDISPLEPIREIVILNRLD